MLISHTHKFIFVKTRKTAGTSIEVDLAKFMGPEDVVTQVYPPEEGHVPRNFRHPNLLKRKFFNLYYYNHLPATEIRRIAGRDVFGRYFKFCVEREPVSKCISAYSMKTRDPNFNAGKEGMSWEEYLEQGAFPDDAHLYLDQDGSLLVDRIIRFEQLDQELAEVCGKLGIALHRVEAKAKAGFRTQIDVTPAQRQLIYDAFSRSLPHTGYEI